MVQSGLTTPEEITFSFEPPSSQQLWTPLQQEHAARVYLQRELAAEDALANLDIPNEFDVTPCPVAPADTEFPSEFDVSPPLDAQPPPPVILKAHQRAILEKRFRARVDSPTRSEDTYQRLLKGYSTSSSTPASPLVSHSVDPAAINRPNAPEPTSFSHYGDQQAEIARLRQENAGLQQELQAYKNMADSLIEKSVERSFGDRDERRLKRRFERLQRRLDEDDSVITQQKIQINIITDERDSLESSLRDTYDLISNMQQDINRYADRIEDLEGDLHDAHHQLDSLGTKH